MKEGEDAVTQTEEQSNDRVRISRDDPATALYFRLGYTCAGHVLATCVLLLLLPSKLEASALWYLVTRPCCLAALRHCSYEGLEHGEEAGHHQVPDWVEEAEQEEVEYGRHNQVWY